MPSPVCRSCFNTRREDFSCNDVRKLPRNVELCRTNASFYPSLPRRPVAWQPSTTKHWWILQLSRHCRQSNSLHYSAVMPFWPKKKAYLTLSFLRPRRRANRPPTVDEFGELIEHVRFSQMALDSITGTVMAEELLLSSERRMVSLTDGLAEKASKIRL